jgi:putative ABC transport system permease protein
MKIAWLLLRRSGKHSRNRLALTAVAIALGVVMMLIFVAGVNALMNRTERSNWRLNFFNNQVTSRPVDGVAPLKVALALGGNLNKYQDTRINVVSMYATGVSSPQLPNMPTPQPGEYYVSRGLEKILKQRPHDNIGQRFEYKKIGMIPDAYVVSPDSLDVVRGMSSTEADNLRVSSIYRFNTASGVSPYSGMTAIVLFIGAAILFVPIIIFLTIATQLGSVQREQRYAALRLISATKRQVTQILLFESLAAAAIGIGVGTAAFLAILPLMSNFFFDGMRFWASDLSVSITQYIAIVTAVLLLCAAANWWGMRADRFAANGRELCG